MATNVTLNGNVYSIPAVGEDNWGQNLTDFFIAIPNGVLQKTGGNFTITADVNFGPNFGLLGAYFSGRSNAATAGLVRLGNAQVVSWRNFAGDGNLDLSVNGSDQLLFDGDFVTVDGITSLTGDVTAVGPGAAVATISNGVITNAKVSASAAIDFSKLAALSSGNILVGSSLNVVTSVPMSGDVTISDSGAALISALAVTNGKLAANAVDNSKVAAAAAIDFSKLAALTDGNILVGSALNVPTSVPMSGDVTIVNSGATTIANNAVSNAKLAQMATQTIKGRTTAGTGNAEDLTATQATAVLNPFVGDSGAGGIKGLVPAPAAGDAAAGKFLKADGTFAIPPGSGSAIEVAVFNETQTSGTDGGTFTSGAWRTRVLNTTQFAQSWASLSSNQITLDAGTYFIESSAPAVQVGTHKARFRNITDSTDDIIGTSEVANSVVNPETTHSTLLGVVQIASTKTFEVQHQCQTTAATFGFGVAASFGGVDEVYTVISITKVG